MHYILTDIDIGLFYNIYNEFNILKKLFVSEIFLYNFKLLIVFGSKILYFFLHKTHYKINI